jgi:MT0933-like antitoxin protein
MGFMDKLKGLEGEAEQAAATHKDAVEKAIEKAEELADKQTGGQHHDAIGKAGKKAEEYVANLQEPGAS